MLNTSEITAIVGVIVAFGIIVTASNHLAKIFQKIKLPLITGFIIIGVLVGPYLLKMIPGDLTHLEFVNDISLAFIALASGIEIYLKEIRPQMKDISIMTIFQFAGTFIISYVMIYYLSEFIPIFHADNPNTNIAVALLISTIFIARSPASAIAVINELRAKGPFTKIALGVTILKDILVIILFAATFSVAEVLIQQKEIDFIRVLLVFTGIIISIGLGLIYGKIFEFLFNFPKNEYLEITIVLFLGWSMFLLAGALSSAAEQFFGLQIHVEALLTGIIASFYLANFSAHREHFEKLVNRFGAYVYAAFFTLIGATFSVDLLIKYWKIALILFGIRLIAVMIASVGGSIFLKKPKKEVLLSWTPYITQAGVSLGLITIVSSHFLEFGVEFEAVLIAVIILNQFIGPPLMKWAIINVKEAHVKFADHKFDYQRDVFILGIGGKAIMLGRTLLKEGYSVQIVTDKKNVDTSSCEIKVNKVDEIDYPTLKNLNFSSADSVVIFRNEDVAFEISELIYEHFGTPNIIVVLDAHTDIRRFKEIGVIVLAPTAALITLLEHFVRSPQATSILLGMQEARETEDIEVLADDVHARALRDLQFPLGILILAVKRKEETILPKGYTRLRKHDIVTVVGSVEQIELVRTKLQY